MLLTSVGVELCVVQVLQDLLNGLDSPVPLDMLGSDACRRGTHCLGGDIHLEVSSYEELTAHDCGI